MSKDILYYPTIDFQEKDYDWLWISALLWDRVYRVVPEGYEFNEPQNIEELCSADEIGISINPREFSKQSSQKFRENLENGSWPAAAFTYDSEDLEYARLHKEKIDVTLSNMLIREKLLIGEGIGLMDQVSYLRTI